jgi:D-glycero-D-manno-heptose 1,7-bisphosphate phosphatase
MRPGIILDRDGTLIDFHRDAALGVVTPAFHPSHVRLLPGVVEGLTMLRDAGFIFAIATNQPDVAKGRLPRSAVMRTHDELLRRLAHEDIVIEQVEACLHHPEPHDGGDPALNVVCDCRKPKSGMLDKIVEDLDLDRAATWMIGDTKSDLGAAHAANVRCALLMQVSRCELCVFGEVKLDGREPQLRAARIDELARAILSA